jgi:3-hexulose-6-phosphate synthase
MGIVREVVDVVEVGTPMLKPFGLGLVSTVNELAPGVPVLVDSKTVDGGWAEGAVLPS